MKILGIVAEYNPFHNGQKYHIDKARELTGADYVVVVMSGNFVQRGEAAILDKWERSRIAVQSGADLVVELPFIFACNKASDFAAGAVDILAGLGATHIAFGSESGDIDALKELVCKLSDHNENITALREAAMSEGVSYAKGTQMAVSEILGEEYVSLMLDPNNILALEYLKRIREKKYNIEAVTVKRFGSGYYDSDDVSGMAGATVIRQMVQNEQDVAKYVPANTANALANSCIDVKVQDVNAFGILKADIVRNSSEKLAAIYSVGEGLENKLKKEIINADSMDSFVESVVSKRYTKAAVKRMLTYILMGITGENPQRSLYARILAAGRNGRELIKKLKKDEIARIPIIMNINKEKDVCDMVWGTLKYDVLASDMYNIISDRSMYDYSDKVIRPYIEV